MATYYVSPSGSDSNPGTIGSPFLTVLHGLTLTNAGDTLYLRAGTYDERIDKKIHAGTSWSSPVTLAGYPSEVATIKATGYAYPINMEGEAKYIILDNLVIDAGSSTGNCIKISRNSSTSPSAHHIRVQNCELKNAPHVCLLIQSRCDYCEILNNSMHNNGKTLDSDGLYSYGIYLKSSYCLIEGNDVYDNGSSGMQIFSTTQSTDPTNYNVVRKNKFHANTTHSAALNRGTGVSVAGGTGNLLYNNLCYNQRSGITVSYCTGTKLYNNTVYGNSVYGIDLRESVFSLIVKNNIVYSNPTNIAEMGSSTKANNLVGINPVFVTPGSNFALQATSPAIDAGTVLSEVTTDYAGVSRPQGSAYDIGAYEYVGGGTPDTTPPTGSITFPTNGSTVTGSVTITCNATDNIGVANVQFYLDGVALGGPVT